MKYLLLLLLISCTAQEQKWETTPAGLEYRITRYGLGPASTSGSTVKIHYMHRKGDTIIYNTNIGMPEYITLIPGAIMPGNPFSVLFENVRQGDSIAVQHVHDSIKLTTFIKVLKIFPTSLSPGTDSLITADKISEWKKYLPQDTARSNIRIKNYLNKHQLEAFKNYEGIYIERLNSANSRKPRITYGNQVTLHYRTIPLHNDSTHPAAHNQIPFDTMTVMIGTGKLSRTIENTLCYLWEDDHVRLYIPAALTHPNQLPPKKPLHDLILELKVQKIEGI